MASTAVMTDADIEAQSSSQPVTLTDDHIAALDKQQPKVLTDEDISKIAPPPNSAKPILNDDDIAKHQAPSFSDEQMANLTKPGAQQAHDEMGDLFAQDNQNQPKPNAPASPGEAFAAETINAAANPIKAMTGKPILSEGEQKAIDQHPAAKFAGDVVGNSILPMTLMATGAVGMLVAWGVGGALQAQGQQTEEVNNPKFQPTPGSAALTDAAQGAINAIGGKIFASPTVDRLFANPKLAEAIPGYLQDNPFVQANPELASKLLTPVVSAIKGGIPFAQNVVGRMAQRATGIAATQFAGDIMQGKDIKTATIDAASNAATGMIIGSALDIPEMRSNIVSEASRLSGEEMDFPKAKAFFQKMDIDPESFSPDFRASAHAAVIQNFKENQVYPMMEKYGASEDIINNVLQDQNMRLRDTATTEWMSSLSKTNPDMAAKLFPFIQQIKGGADPYEVMYAINLHDKILGPLQSKIMQLAEANKGEGNAATENATNEPAAANAEKAPIAPAGKDEQGNDIVPQPKGPAQAGVGGITTPQAQTAATAAGGRSSQPAAAGTVKQAVSLIQQIQKHGGIDYSKWKEAGYTYEDAKQFGILGVFKSAKGGKGINTPDGLASELHNSNILRTPEGKDHLEHLVDTLKYNRTILQQEHDANHADYESQYNQWLVKKKEQGYGPDEIKQAESGAQADLEKEEKSTANPQDALWTNEEQPGSTEHTPSGQLRHELQPPIPGSLFQEKGELFDQDKDLGLQKDEGPKYRIEAPAFYSQASKVIDEKMPNAASPEQIKGILSEKNGVKQDELKWMGLDDFLAGKSKVTKAELKDFIDKNNVQIKEKTYGGEEKDNEYVQKLKSLEDKYEKEKVAADTITIKLGSKPYMSGNPIRWVYKQNGGKIVDVPEHLTPYLDKAEESKRNYEDYQEVLSDEHFSPIPTKFHQYQLPGGSNYRELLLTLPLDTKSPDIKRLGGGKWTIDGRPATREEALSYPLPQDKAFKSGHFDEPNILAHIRMNDRTDADGKKNLFIEEVQSDWHQKGKKLGYRENTNMSDKEMRDRIQEIETKGMNGKEVTSAEKQEWARLKSIVDNKGVPDAPFKKTWQELAMKRMLRYAAENGYDRLSWTTGDQQAKRYDLSKQIDEIRYEKKDNGLYDISIYNDGNNLTYNLKIPSNLNESEIEKYVGKEIAKRIVNDEGISDEALGNEKALTGEQLKVGGEGMKGFYDQILPSFMNKYAKKWGGRVGETTILKGLSGFENRVYEGRTFGLTEVKALANKDWDNSRINKQLKDIVKAYENADAHLTDAEAFKKAVEEHGSPALAKEVFGGELKAIAEVNKEKVHSIDITPTMKESVMAGQPMFKTAPTWESLQKNKEAYAQANKAGEDIVRKLLGDKVADERLFNFAYPLTVEGGKALGIYYKGQIGVLTGQGLADYIHESGHYVWDMFQTLGEKNVNFLKGRDIWGNDKSNKWIEEKVMRGLEEYAKENGFIPDTSIFAPFKSFFRRIIWRIKQFLGIDPVPFQSFYDAILGGKYRNALPVKSYDAEKAAQPEAAKYSTKEEFNGPSAFDPAIQAVAKMSKEIISVLAPRTLVPRESLDMVMAGKGQLDKFAFVMETRLKELKKSFAKMPQDEQIAFADRIKTGQKQSTEALDAVANMIRITENNRWAEAKALKPSLAFKENHFRIPWKVIPGSPESKGFHGLFKKPFQGTQGWTKKSTLADMSEGLAKGGIPYSYNPIENWEASMLDMQKFITATRMWNNLKKMGMVKYVRQGESVPRGMVMVDDRISHVYLPVEATPIGAKEGTEPFNANLEMGKYFVEEGTGRILNNFLGRDYIRESTLGGSLLAFKNLTTGIELSLSPFHAAYTTLMASSSNIGLGLQKIANRGLIMGEGKAFLEGLADIAHGVPGAGAARYFDLGTKAIQYLSHDEFVKSKAGQDFIKAFPEAAQLLDDLFMGGGQLAQHQDYKITALKAFTQGIRDFGDAKRSFMVAQANKDAKLMQKYAAEMAGNAWAEVIHLLPSVNQMFMAPLFQMYIPRLKIGAFLSEYSNDLIARRDQLESGRLTRPQLARETWDSVERRFGEMNFDNIFWNRNFKTALQITFRSVTWKIGALQNIGGAGTGTIRDLAAAVQDKELPKLNRNLAMILGLALMVTVFGEVLQKLLTGKNLGQRDDGKEDFGLLLKDAMDPRYDANGNRLSFNTHLKDWAHLFHSPGGFIANSTSGFIGRVIEDWNNKDFFNTQIHNPRDPVYKQAWDLLVHLIPLNFMITNQYQLKMQNAPKVVRVMTAMGFTTPAPGYVTQTPVYQMAQKMMEDKPYNQIVKSKAQEDHIQMMSQLRQNYEATKNVAPLQAAEHTGKITMEQYLNIKKEAKMTPLARIASSKSMNFDDVSQLMLKAISTKSVDEQNTLWPIVREKYFNTMEHLSQEARAGDRAADLKAVYNDIRAKLGK